jgi:hypothetical protein
VCEAEATTVGATCDLKKSKGTGCQPELGLYCGPDGHCAADALVSAPAACGRLGAAAADAGAADGGDAGPVDFSVARCVAGAVCDPTGTTAGTCTAPAVDGAPCDRVNGPSCLAPARCVSANDASTAGVCLLPGASACQ